MNPYRNILLPRSIGGSLNRFTVYLGKLKKKNFSAVLLPKMIRIESDKQKIILKTCNRVEIYFVEVQISLEGNFIFLCRRAK